MLLGERGTRGLARWRAFAVVNTEIRVGKSNLAKSRGNHGQHPLVHRDGRHYGNGPAACLIEMYSPQVEVLAI